MPVKQLSKKSILDDPNVYRLFHGEDPQDEIDWIEQFLTIPSPQGPVVDFILYPQQVQMALTKTGRDITVKGRQTRASSYILAKNLRRMVVTPSLTCLIMTQDDQTTARFRERLEHHLKDLNRAGFPFTYKANADRMELTETGSVFLFGSGQEATAGRAYTASIAHLSEVAHWPDARARALLGGILPSVPGAPNGWIDIESTPNGAEGTFYERMLSSNKFDTDSPWTGHFYPWSMEPRYRAGTTPDCDMRYSEAKWQQLLAGFRPTDEEKRVMGLLNLDVGQVLWRRVTKKDQDKTDAPFLQEYVESLEGCFLTKGGNYFGTPDGINHLEQYRASTKEPKEIVETVPELTTGFSGGGLHVWQRPQAGTPYALWVDCAGGGLDDSADYSAVVVLDCANLAVAARLAVKVAPQEIAPMAVAIAKWYNNALLGGERDAFGSVCIAKIQELGYKNLWYFMEPGKAMSIGKAIEDPWGHPTQIRQHILTTLREKVFGGLFHTSDAWMVQQMGAFTWQKVAQKRHGLKEAGKGQKDDLVMCAAGVVYIAPLAGSRREGQGTPSGAIEEGEVVTVGAHGVVLNRSRGGAQRSNPWHIGR
ncbi:hypothetical protein LCGC14_1445030 [marine sediment metagenome]|uniref:Terminase large subunit gp17-like C-terminal domain-containing protein n=1 Tax=marine sediment metagenome TaxID=412755 RepID=A0A0F9M012_9ZZZZ